MPTKGFTKIDNSVIWDSDLSLEALGLYVKLKHLSTIDNFLIKRDHIKSISGYGETAFRRVWKELKDKGVLIETKTRVKGRYEYVYTLKTIAPENATEVVAPREEKKPKTPVDSDRNVQIEGQMNIDDVLGAEQEEPAANENITEIVKATGFNNFQSEELLQIAGNDVYKVINGHRYTLDQEDVKNIFSYTKWAIRNNKVIFESTKRNESPIKSTFNHFRQRKYDFDKLKMALLYGDPYELPV